jgi:hypothetical protein
MMMRFHLGLGIGHTYSHSHYESTRPQQSTNTANVSQDLNCGASEDNDVILDDMDLDMVFMPSHEDAVQGDSDCSDDSSTDVDIDWENGVQDVSESSDASGSDDDDELMGMYEMYGQ